ncbi:unnamed protein product, partial [Effrenium voratum]
LLLADLRERGDDALRSALQQRRVGDGRSPWLLSCAAGRLPNAQSLCSQAEALQMDLANDRDRAQRGALLLAARGGHVEVCSWLLEARACQGLLERDSCLWTPLHAASAEGHKEAVAWLLQQGADPTLQDEDGHSPRSLAQLRGHGAVESLLRRAK